MKHKLSLRFFKGILKFFKFEAGNGWIEPEFTIEKRSSIITIQFTCRSYYYYDKQSGLQMVDDISLQDFLIAPFNEIKIDHYPESERRYHNDVYTAISLILFSFYFEGIKEKEVETCFTDSRILYFRKVGTDVQIIKIFTEGIKAHSLSQHDHDAYAVFSTKLKNKKLSTFK